jgi:hypothetical protein
MLIVMISLRLGNSSTPNLSFSISNLCVLSLFLLIISLAKNAGADKINQGVFPVDSKPFGVPYSEWAAKYWQWYFSIPKEQNPLNDPSGAKCSVNQNNTTVWFLDQIPSGSAVLNCNIPAGKAILTPILAGECDYLEDASSKTEADLGNCAFSGIQGGTMQVAVDGITLKNLQSYLVETPLFKLTIPIDNTLGATTVGTSQAKAVGYYLFLGPLAPGKHAIHESYSIVDNPTLGTYSGAIDETYNIEVKP